MIKISDVTPEIDVPRLAQTNDKMFERNISIMGERKMEVVVLSSLQDAYVGFIAGLDEKFMQLCLTDTGHYVLVSREFIVSVEQTGKSLDDIEDERLKTHIDRRISHFSRVSSKLT